MSECLYFLSRDFLPGLYSSLASIRTRLLLNFAFTGTLPCCPCPFLSQSLPYSFSLRIQQPSTQRRHRTYDFLLDMVPAAGSPPVAIVAPQLSRSTNVSIERPCTWIPANLASIRAWPLLRAPASTRAKLLYEHIRYLPYVTGEKSIAVDCHSGE